MREFIDKLIMLCIKVVLFFLFSSTLECSGEVKKLSNIKKLPSSDYVLVSKTIDMMQPADSIAIINNVYNRFDCLLLCRNHRLCVSTSYIPDAKLCILSETALKQKNAQSWIRIQNPIVSHYNELLYEADLGLVLPKTRMLGHGKAPPLCSMNMMGDQFLKYRQKRIVDGITPVPYQVPWMGLLAKNHRMHCTAFIIAKNFGDKSSFWALSAKHCFRSGNVEDDEDKIDLKPFALLFGVHDIRFITQHIVHRTIAAVYLHPDEGIKPKDLALIRLSRFVKFNSYINGLCLPDSMEEFELYDDSVCATCGFGATKINLFPVVGSNTLQCTEVFVHKPDLDHNLFSDWNSVVKLKAIGFGPYHGDSGSPIFCLVYDPQPFLFAVVTGGQSMLIKKAYLTAARISYFMDFISGNMLQDNDLCCAS